MKKIKNVFLILTGLVTAACSSAGLTAINAPAAFKPGNVIEDVAYGNHPDFRLDIYVPEAADKTKQDFPVVVFFHGGRWTDGDKSKYAFVGKKLNEYGFMTVIPDYRKYPEVKFPKFIDDTAAAIAYTHDYISEYGGNPDRIYVMGHSSGAHMAALVLADKKYLKVHGKKPTAIKGFAGLAGPYDFAPEAEDTKDMFGPPENYKNMQVTNFTNGDEPPMLLMHGTDDDLVDIANLEKLEAGISKNGGPAQVKVLDGINHTDLVRDFSWFDVKDIDIPKAVTDFFNQYK